MGNYTIQLKELLEEKLKNVKEDSNELSNLITLLNKPEVHDLLNDFLEEKEEATSDNISLLGTLLKCCSTIYELSGESTGLSDSEYDALVEYYREKSGNDIIGTTVDADNVYHKYSSLRGTLDKIYKLTNEDVIKNKSQKSIKDWVNTAQKELAAHGRDDIDLWEEEVYGFPKFDGVSCVFECNKDGKLERALTRGNTTTNEAKDITHIVRSVFKDPIVNPTGPHGIKTEIMMVNEDFDTYNKLYGTDYKNTRSIVSSILNSKEVDERVDYLHIVPLRYSYLVDNGVEGPQMLVPSTFNYPCISCKLKELDKLHDFAFSHSTVSPGLRCDGMVIYFKNEEVQKILGRKDNRQKFEVAFKFTEETAYSKVVDVEFTTGLFGRMNPVVRFKPVNMKGNKIERASLGSYQRFRDLALCYGDTIKILYDIIPYGDFDSKDPKCKRSGKDLIPAPLICPECNHALEENEEGTILYCNNSECPCRVKGKILNFINKMNIREISYATVDDFYNAGYLKSIDDLYKLEKHKKKLIKLDGYGENKINKIIDEIDKQRYPTPSLLLGSIGIEGVAVKTFATVLSMFTLDEVIELSEANAVDAFTVVPGIKEKTAMKIVNGINENIDLINFLEEELEIIPEPKIKGNFSVVFTKIRDDDVEKFIKDNGGVVTDSLTKDTSLLIVPAIGVSSSKVTKAEKYGIPIVNVEDAYDYISDMYL